MRLMVTAVAAPATTCAPTTTSRLRRTQPGTVMGRRTRPTCPEAAARRKSTRPGTLCYTSPVRWLRGRGRIAGVMAAIATLLGLGAAVLLLALGRLPTLLALAAA